MGRQSFNGGPAQTRRRVRRRPASRPFRPVTLVDWGPCGCTVWITGVPWCIASLQTRPQGSRKRGVGIDGRTEHAAAAYATGNSLRGSAPINRTFVIQFPDRASKDRFFTDSQYLEIRARLFNRAVDSTTIIAEYTR